jgi:hypothetical protein
MRLLLRRSFEMNRRLQESAKAAKVLREIFAKAKKQKERDALRLAISLLEARSFDAGADDD